MLASRSRLFIATLELGAAAGRLFEAQALGTPEKLLGALKAATAAPLLVRARHSVEGLRCMDAGIVNAFPVEDAIAHGCTDILVMLTRPSATGAARRVAPRAGCSTGSAPRATPRWRGPSRFATRETRASGTWPSVARLRRRV